MRLRTEVQPSVIDLLLLVLVLQAAFKFQITFSARANGIERETFRLGYRLVLHFNWVALKLTKCALFVLFPNFVFIRKSFKNIPKTEYGRINSYNRNI